MTSRMVTDWQLSALQWCSTPEPAENLARLRALLALLPRHPHHLVVLPECALIFGGPEGWQQGFSEPLGQGPWQRELSALACEFQLYLLLGSFPTLSTDPARFSASSLLFAPDGSLLADYQKLHLFDVEVADSTGSYRESDSTMAGEKVTLADCQGLKLGLTICYDVRFPGLMQQLAAQGMQVLAVPSAFTRVTGAAHWHSLLRARAIETQCFVVAPNQTGVHANGRETFGHSLIIDPYGRVLADAGVEPGWISSRIDLNELTAVRQAMPLWQHNRFNCELTP
ncbi:carbon-nitrogen hydrolase family protein [Alkalimonas sp. NCh-2]|uniref:carbon-nitrogen hydrolase family protein n=1 Tax=Alkalimonas sp. NCh-2 TaxID=3144846 RepID=UPI0031F6A81C